MAGRRATTSTRGSNQARARLGGRVGPEQHRAAERSNAPRTFAPCVKGMAADFFPCDGIDLLSHVSHAELGTTFVNDIWGWTDPADQEGLRARRRLQRHRVRRHLRPKRPKVLGILPSASDVGNPFWRDIKVFAEPRLRRLRAHRPRRAGLRPDPAAHWDGATRPTTPTPTTSVTARPTTSPSTRTPASPTPSAPAPTPPPAAEPGDRRRAVVGGGDLRGHRCRLRSRAGRRAGHRGVRGGRRRIGHPAEGCGPLVGFPAGAIAIADRGTCPFTRRRRTPRLPVRSRWSSPTTCRVPRSRWAAPPTSRSPR
jgi:hypothetical protein